jgi:EF-P beta-lysylation protein EpmB
MITRSPIGEEDVAWRDELRQGFREPNSLLRALGLNPEAFDLPTVGETRFPFRVTTAYASRMRHGDAQDPLLLQVLPDARELLVTTGYSDDPVGEFSFTEGQNLIQKYAGRALLVMTGSCAINCRYCFRRAFPYSETAGRSALDRGLAAIAADVSIREVILSGGDPLMLDNAAIENVLTHIATIKHVTRVRFHTRLPVVLPGRITEGLLRILGDSPLSIVVVIHANHPHEIDAATALALTRCRNADVTLLNQSVLLRRINDNVVTLADLSERLFAAKVLPYYIHLLDRVSGTAHFEVTAARALELERQLRARLPGYLMPRFVREVAGAEAKLPQSDGSPVTTLL